MIHLIIKNTLGLHICIDSGYMTLQGVFDLKRVGSSNSPFNPGHTNPMGIFHNIMPCNVFKGKLAHAFNGNTFI